MGTSLWVDGQPIEAQVRYPWGELQWGHTAPGGCKAASWRMDLPSTYSHPALRRRRVGEVKTGSLPLWAGVLTDPDIDDDWTFSAVGFADILRADALALDASFNATTTPDVAVDQAIARFPEYGLSRPASLSSVPFVTDGQTDTLPTVGALLDSWATGEGKRWGVNAFREVYAVSEPTVPTYYIVPGTGRFGLTDENYASDLFVRYLASGLGYATEQVADTVAREFLGRREVAVNATGQGLLDSTGASSLGDGILAKGKAKLGYTNSLEVSRHQLTTPGGQPASLQLVREGALVRHFGLQNEQGQPVPYLDWVIGETNYQAGAESITLAPVGVVARSTEDIIAEALGGTAA